MHVCLVLKTCLPLSLDEVVVFCFVYFLLLFAISVSLARTFSRLIESQNTLNRLGNNGGRRYSKCRLLYIEKYRFPCNLKFILFVKMIRKKRRSRGVALLSLQIAAHRPLLLMPLKQSWARTDQRLPVSIAPLSKDAIPIFWVRSWIEWSTF